jgi:hypothetical protein
VIQKEFLAPECSEMDGVELQYRLHSKPIFRFNSGQVAGLVCGQIQVIVFTEG